MEFKKMHILWTYIYLKKTCLYKYSSFVIKQKTALRSGII